MTHGGARSGPNSRLTDLGLRAGGVALLAVAAFAIRILYYRAWPSSRLEPGALDFLLAAIGFIASSAGATLLLLGTHIFDQVFMSERWAHRDVVQPRSNDTGSQPRPVMPSANGDQQEDQRERAHTRFA